MQNRRQFVSASLGSVVALSACAHNKPARSALTTDQQFKNKFDGLLVERGDPQYESFRTGSVWQMDVPERLPELIVRPQNEQALAFALTHARESGMQVTCKSGGHNIAASFLRDSGMLIDLSAFNQVGSVSDDNHVWVGPAAWAWHLAQAIEPQGYSFPYAHCATVSMGGYLLGGGVGINGDAWGGIGCHSVSAVKVMLPSGEIVVADEGHYADLFWSARGAGTGFVGAVLAFKLKLYPEAVDIKEQVTFYPIEAAKEVADWQQRVAQICPKNIEMLTLLTHRPPPMQGKTPAEQKMCVSRLAAFGEANGDAVKALDKIKSIPMPGAKLFTPPTASISMNDILVGSIDPGMGMGFGRYSVETIWTNTFAEAVGSLVAPIIAAPSTKTHVLATPRHGASLRSDAAFSSLGQSFVGIYDIWDDPDDDQANVKWTHAASAAMSPYSVGRYINEIDGFAFPEKISSCFSSDAFSRLEKVRNHYDYDRLFHDFPGTKA